MTRRVVQQVEIDARPADVWRHLTDRAGLSRWLMPTDDFEARPGHAFTFHTAPVGDVGGWDGVVRCRVLEVIDERRLSWTWTSNALRVETVVVITLDDLGGGHSSPSTTPAGRVCRQQAWLADEHGRGWGHLLARQLKPQWRDDEAHRARRGPGDARDVRVGDRLLGANPLPYRSWKRAVDDETAQRALRDQFPEVGTYFVPSVAHDEATLGRRYAAGPVGFVHVTSLGRPVHDLSIMVKGLILDLLAATALALLLMTAAPVLSTYGRRVGFCVLAGAGAALLIDGGDVAWWSIAWEWKLHQAAYSASVWSVGGLVLARFVDRP